MTEDALKEIEARHGMAPGDCAALVAEVRRYQRALAWLVTVASYKICANIEADAICDKTGNCAACFLRAALAAADEVKP